ncbi:MAG: 3-deoxy-D-manno-octulosonic acid transferase [Bergeyella sp.]|nr:3-deoxy-D-manno-octulosonic acid transferase [Bergeyella sp.]
MISQRLYSLFIFFLRTGIALGSQFNDKLKKGHEGRKSSLDRVKKILHPQDSVLWMHAASLGEYEQGLPVFEQLKKHYFQCKTLLTFFSPSGYEFVERKTPNIADVICYLPYDEFYGMKAFVACFTPKIFFTVKYDFWYHLLSVLKERKTSVYVVSALFYDKQVFFRSYGKWMVKNLKMNVDTFFHQTERSKELAMSIGLMSSVFSGDTRMDRVKETVSKDLHIKGISAFCDKKLSIVFGSAWQGEDEIAQNIYERHPEIKLLIAPHDLKRVALLKKRFFSSVLYSEWKEQPVSEDFRVLIIDSIGLLSRLYSYGDIAVVGGGFHSGGLHNILEAAVFGLPVIFGNHYKKNPEADALISAGGAKTFSDTASASDFVSKLVSDSVLRKSMSLMSKDFVERQPSASALVVGKVLSDIP